MAKKVLICDDEIYIRELVNKVVKKEGYETLVAQSGFEGLSLACEELPDLIILDLTMPGTSGYEICNTLKRQSETEKIYIIVLTGNLLEMDDKWKGIAKPDYVITKPFAPSKLRRKLHEVLDH